MVSSARRSLRERVEQARARNYKDFPVPAVGVVLRCRALTAAELSSALARPDEVEGAIDVLTATCIGIYEEVDGKGISPVDGFSGVVDLESGHLSGDLPTFRSQELADALGVGDLRDVGVGAAVRALLATKSDIVIDALGGEVTRWSGSTSDPGSLRGN